MGGMQIRMWNVLPKSEKKTTLHQAAREQGYKFIRDHGPRSNNSNQFMEWTDERVHLPGGKLEGWQEGKVKEAFNTCFRGRQKAKTIVLAVYLEKLCGMGCWMTFWSKSYRPCDSTITWIGRTRAGKSLGSKIVNHLLHAVSI